VRILCHYDMSFIFSRTIFLPNFKDKTLIIVTPFWYLSYRMFCYNSSFFYQVNSFRFQKQFKSVLSWNCECQCKRTLRTNLKELIFNSKKVEMIFVQICEIINDTLFECFLIIEFIHPQGEASFNIFIGLIWQFNLLDTSSQHAHLP